jgi:glucose/arabinose dehydrogenase
MRRLQSRAAATAAALVFVCAPAAPAASAEYAVEILAEGLAHPWSIAFLPDGDLLVTERNGGLRRVRDDKLDAAAIEGVPPALAETDGGLLGLALHPRFARNR